MNVARVLGPRYRGNTPDTLRILVAWNADVMINLICNYVSRYIILYINNVIILGRRYLGGTPNNFTITVSWYFDITWGTIKIMLAYYPTSYPALHPVNGNNGTPISVE